MPTTDELAEEIEELKAEIEDLTTGTRYVVDPTTNACVAIVGDISHDNNGNSTGLTGCGLASFKTGTCQVESGWFQVG